ncbi:cytochrome P450 [Streptomyces sp. RKAG337]|uniref:cytochrome P450 n=1 Tax=Streptomyces sp. RKAG337 TaxID=2893404 RepID=UPI00203435FD|nr:cytochrome P450 [Streptomyces sp. RKAG337]MCM2427008.1 cytochrome P450 [Streptomyces sp. RKAG337]
MTQHAVRAVEALFTPQAREDPVPVYRALHDDGPVHRLNDDWVVVCGYEEVDQALRSPVFQVKDSAFRERTRPGWTAGHPSAAMITDSVIRARSPHHERVRQLLSRPLTARRAAGLDPAVSEHTRGLLDRLAELGAGGEPVDFVAHFAYPLPIALICDLLGVPAADRAWFRHRATDLSYVLEPAGQERDLSRADEAATRLLDYFTSLVDERRARPQEDLVSDLVRVSDVAADRLSERELLVNLVLMLAAGFETTASLLGNGLSVLLDRPADQDRLARDPASAAAYVQEILRYDPPAQATDRWATEDTAIGGVRVTEGTQVLLLLGAANRDPRRFSDPDAFDPDRPAHQSLAFGAGPHFCLGSALARMEAETALQQLCARFPRMTRAGGSPRTDRLALRGHAALPVRLG